MDRLPPADVMETKTQRKYRLKRKRIAEDPVFAATYRAKMAEKQRAYYERKKAKDPESYLAKRAELQRKRVRAQREEGHTSSEVHVRYVAKRKAEGTWRTDAIRAKERARKSARRASETPESRKRRLALAAACNKRWRERHPGCYVEAYQRRCKRGRRTAYVATVAPRATWISLGMAFGDDRLFENIGVGLPHHDRDELLACLALELLEGNICREDIGRRAAKLRSRMTSEKLDAISVDAFLPGSSTVRYIDTIASPDGS